SFFPKSRSFMRFEELASRWSDEIPETNGQPLPIPPDARPLSAFVRRSGDDPDELLKHRFLCCGAGLLFCGPTGVGKSVATMQAMILWGLGREAFGIEPTRPLKSLLVQAENDDGDLAEMRDGVIRGLQLTEEEAELACANIVVAREDEKTGALFIN